MIDLRAAWLAVKGAWATIRVCLWLALVVAACLYGRGCGRDERAVEVERLKAQHAQAEARQSAALAQLATDYRNRERAMGEAFIAAATQHTEAMRHANEQSNAVLAGLRAGTLRLQKHWAAPVPGTPAAAADPRGAADAAERRAADTGALVGIGAEFDAFAALCLNTLKAERSPSTVSKTP